MVLSPDHAASGLCICGKRKTVNIVVEFRRGDGQMDYAGGRFCYAHGTQICYAIPEGATLTEVRIYDWREPDEQIRITAAARPPAAAA